MKLGIFVQARMNSKRLPGKVLFPLNGRPLLEYLLERLKRVKSKVALGVVTSKMKHDDPIKKFCNGLDIFCFRGDLNNVAQRYKDVISAKKLDGFIRVSGDSPLIDPDLIDRAIDYFQEDQYDIVTNVFPRTFPKGQSVEAIRSSFFYQESKKFETKEDFEHVTPYFYKNASKYRIKNFSSENNFSHIQMSVDYPEDLECIGNIISIMGRPYLSYGWRELVSLYEQEKGIKPSGKE